MMTGFLALPSPRLPERRWTATGKLFAITGLLHALTVAVLLVALPARRNTPENEARRSPEVIRVIMPRIVFEPSGSPGSGGGGGGNRQSGPIRHAEGVGRDALTLRTRPAPEAAEQLTNRDEPLPQIVLDARPLASGNSVQTGLPVGGVSFGTSTGPGSGGGVGTGTGTGIGAGHGPGVGAGSGGGTGGGVYRPGGNVTAPRLISEVRPRYTSEALGQKIQGSVWLEIVVTRDGRVDRVDVVRSLDPGGLDDQAVTAVRRWQFEPGRLAGTPVDVMVTVVMDFSIR
jgi:periplasmic protein TonB